MGRHLTATRMKMEPEVPLLQSVAGLRLSEIDQDKRALRSFGI